jgi:hypothetical protein
MPESATATKLAPRVATLDASRSSTVVRMLCYFVAAALVAVTLSGLLALTAVSR